MTVTNWSTRPSTGQAGNDCAIDLVQFFVANLLRSGNLPNFVDGSNSKTAGPGLIMLYPGYLEDGANDAAFFQVDSEPRGYAIPLRKASVRMLIRCADDPAPLADGTQFSGRLKAEQAAQAVCDFLKPDPGNMLGDVALNSGRYVLSFQEAKSKANGLDQKDRFEVLVTFDMIYRDINVA